MSQPIRPFNAVYPNGVPVFRVLSGGYGHVCADGAIVVGVDLPADARHIVRVLDPANYTEVPFSSQPGWSFLKHELAPLNADARGDAGEGRAVVREQGALVTPDRAWRCAAWLLLACATAAGMVLATMGG